MKLVSVKGQVGEQEIDFSLYRSDMPSEFLTISSELLDKSAAVCNSGQLEGISYLQEMSVEEDKTESNEVYFHYFLRKNERIFRFLLARSPAGKIIIWGLQEEHARQVERGNSDVMTLIQATLASQIWGEKLFDVISIGQHYPVSLEEQQKWFAEFVDVAVDETPNGMILIPGRSKEVIQSSPNLTRLWFRRLLALTFQERETTDDFLSPNISAAFAMEIAVQYNEAFSDPLLILEFNQRIKESGGPENLIPIEN